MGQKNHCNRMINSKDLPLIPDKLYFSIGEVSRLCSLEPHVLRYWEQEFSTLSPIKRRGNRRYYQRQDVVMVRRIRSLLYDNGYTIDGARKQLQLDKEGSQVVKSSPCDQERWVDELESILYELEAIPS